MIAAVNIKILVIALANFARAVEHGKTVPVIVGTVIALTVVAMVVAVYSFGRAVQAWERQYTSHLDTDLSDEIDQWETAAEEAMYEAWQNEQREVSRMEAQAEAWLNNNPTLGPSEGSAL